MPEPSIEVKDPSGERMDLKIILQVIFSLGFVVSLAVFLFLAGTRSEDQQAALFGYSWTRLLLNGLLALASLAFLWLALRAWRKPTAAAFTAQVETRLMRPTTFALVLLAALLVFFSSALGLLLASLADITRLSAYLINLEPVIVWLACLSLLSVFGLILWQNGWRVFGLWVFIIPLLLALAGAGMNMRLWQIPDQARRDIFYTQEDGKRLAAGENPYARVLSSDMLHNEKYSTYFPLFYVLSAITTKLGLQAFGQWLAFWRFVFLLFNLSIALLMYGLLLKQGAKALAVFAMLFWLFNRWTLGVAFSADLDFIPIFLLLFSLAIFPRSQIASGLLFGLSLSFKQIAIFMLPLYLVWAWQAAGVEGIKNASKLKNVAKMVVAVAVFPLVTSLPFLAWNAAGFIKSILFSVTRLAEAGINAPSLDIYFGWTGLAARLPLLILLFLIYLAAFRLSDGRFSSGLLVMAAFTFFNPVVFKGYLAWLVPFIPLAIYELIRSGRLLPGKGKPPAEVNEY